jgi:hypothetical protein
VASSTLLSTLLGNIGAALQGNSGIDLITPIVGGGGVSPLFLTVDATFSQLGRQLGGNAYGQVASMFSSFVTGEIADTLTSRASSAASSRRLEIRSRTSS